MPESLEEVLTKACREQKESVPEHLRLAMHTMKQTGNANSAKELVRLAQSLTKDNHRFDFKEFHQFIHYNTHLTQLLNPQQIKKLGKSLKKLTRNQNSYLDEINTNISGIVSEMGADIAINNYFPTLAKHLEKDAPHVKHLLKQATTIHSLFNGELDAVLEDLDQLNVSDQYKNPTAAERTIKLITSCSKTIEQEGALQILNYLKTIQKKQSTSDFVRETDLLQEVISPLFTKEQFNEYFNFFTTIEKDYMETNLLKEGAIFARKNKFSEFTQMYDKYLEAHKKNNDMDYEVEEIFKLAKYANYDDVLAFYKKSIRRHNRHNVDKDLCKKVYSFGGEELLHELFYLAGHATTLASSERLNNLLQLTTDLESTYTKETAIQFFKKLKKAKELSTIMEVSSYTLQDKNDDKYENTFPSKIGKEYFEKIISFVVEANENENPSGFSSVRNIQRFLNKVIKYETVDGTNKISNDFEVDSALHNLSLLAEVNGGAAVNLAKYGANIFKEYSHHTFREVAQELMRLSESGPRSASTLAQHVEQIPVFQFVDLSRSLMLINSNNKKQTVDNDEKGKLFLEAIINHNLLENESHYKLFTNHVTQSPFQDDKIDLLAESIQEFSKYAGEDLLRKYLVVLSQASTKSKTLVENLLYTNGNIAVYTGKKDKNWYDVNREPLDNTQIAEIYEVLEETIPKYWRLAGAFHTLFREHGVQETMKVYEKYQGRIQTEAKTVLEELSDKSNKQGHWKYPVIRDWKAPEKNEWY